MSSLGKWCYNLVVYDSIIIIIVFKLNGNICGDFHTVSKFLL